MKKYQHLVIVQPKNLSAWEGLINAQLHEAGGETYVSNGKLNSKGKELFSQVAQSWNSYLALNPPKPNPKLAKEMVRIFGEEGLNEPAAAAAVLQIVVASEPQSAALFGALAEYAYKAKNTRQGDLAAAKAVSLAPAAERSRLKKELAELKKSGGATTAATSCRCRDGHRRLGEHERHGGRLRRHRHDRRQDLPDPDRLGRRRRHVYGGEIASEGVAGCLG